ncbi:hypothetical protein PS173_005011 [Salmonella enterica]|nr:hypothetical protein [Salmonella enterica]
MTNTKADGNFVPDVPTPLLTRYSLYVTDPLPPGSVTLTSQPAVKISGFVSPPVRMPLAMLPIWTVDITESFAAAPPVRAPFRTL